MSTISKSPSTRREPLFITVMRVAAMEASGADLRRTLAAIAGQCGMGAERGRRMRRQITNASRANGRKGRQNRNAPSPKAKNPTTPTRTKMGSTSRNPRPCRAQPTRRNGRNSSCAPAIKVPTTTSAANPRTAITISSTTFTDLLRGPPRGGPVREFYARPRSQVAGPGAKLVPSVTSGSTGEVLCPPHPPSRFAPNLHNLDAFHRVARSSGPGGRRLPSAARRANMLTAQDNATLVRAHYDLFNQHNLDKAVAMVSDTVKWTNVPFDMSFHGQAGYRQFLENWTTGMPDAKIE